MWAPLEKIIGAVLPVWRRVGLCGVNELRLVPEPGPSLICILSR